MLVEVKKHKKKVRLNQAADSQPCPLLFVVICQLFKICNLMRFFSSHPKKNSFSKLCILFLKLQPPQKKSSSQVLREERAPKFARALVPGRMKMLKTTRPRQGALGSWTAGPRDPDGKRTLQ